MNASFASDLSDLQAAREKAMNDYMAALISQKANTPAAQAALRHQIVDPVEASYKDFMANKMGSGPKGPAAPIRPMTTVGPQRLSSNNSSGSSPAFQGLSSSRPFGNGDSKPVRQDVVLDGSKIPKELVFEKQVAPAQQRSIAGASSATKSSAVPKSGSQVPVKNPAGLRQFNETSDLLKLDKYSDPVH